jgi:hypothetical protein
MCLQYPRLTLQDCSFNLCYFSFISSLLSISQIGIVLNKQGSVRQELETALTERATAQLTAHFLALEINVLREQELQNRCVLHLFVSKNTKGNPRVRKRKRPVTPGVPARVDRH